MKTFNVITRRTFVGTTKIVAESEIEARKIISLELTTGDFEADVEIQDHFRVAKVYEKV